MKKMNLMQFHFWLFSCVCMLFVNVHVSLGFPAKATDVFRSPCKVLSDPYLPNQETQGYSLWSSPSTWPGGKVPGIASQVGSDAVIPCGTRVLLDVPNVSLGLLHVQGLLRVKDDPSLPTITVQSHYVLVEGQLSAGSATQHFRQKLTFELTPNTEGGRAELLFSSFLPADPANPRKLGHKAFVVVGGRVQLFGMPKGTATASWVKLEATAVAGQNYLVLNNNKVASTWPVGGTVAIASTDFDWKQAETRVIVKTRGTSRTSILYLDRPLDYMHYGNPVGLPDGLGGYVNECAEVALLTRNIVIRGTQEAAPYDLQGGHFMVFMTPVPQHIEGVEFVHMGQQGVLGRYPVHFHILGSVPGNVCRKNVIRGSLQRCVVLHATDNMAVDRNVAYDTFGHCFMTEEGGETGNTFNNNLGMSTKEVRVRISADETDDRPSTFWISNSQNKFLDNVAAGGDSSGFWIEHRFAVRGASANIPRLADILPFRQTILKFSGNTAHSYKTAGLRTYPAGWRPRNSNGDRVKAGTIENLLVYKNTRNGVFLHITEQLTLSGSTFADNGVGVFMSRVIGNVIDGCRVIGQTANVGTPRNCTKKAGKYTACKPLKGCKMPLASDALGRSSGNMLHTDPIFGIQIETYTTVDPYPLPIRVQKTSFSKFGSLCASVKQSAIMAFGDGNYWCPAHLEKLTFDSESVRVWLPPKQFQYLPLGKMTTAGEQSAFLSLWDKDGSVSGVANTFLVANNAAAMLPPAATLNSRQCVLSSPMNGYACSSVCYRSMVVTYDELGWSATAQSVTALQRGDVSHIVVTRSDGAVLTLDGNMNDAKSADLAPDERFFGLTLLAGSGSSYVLEVVGPTRDPTWSPSQISVRFMDEGGCGQPLTLQLKPSNASSQWRIDTSEGTTYASCPGSAMAASDRCELSYKCTVVGKGVEGVAMPTLLLGPDFTDTATLYASTSLPSGSTCDPATNASNSACTLQWSGSPDWLYDATGREMRPWFYKTTTNTQGWQNGSSPLGYDVYNSPILRSLLPVPSPTRITYYFRRSFLALNSACIASLLVDVLVKDGVVVYLNGREVWRQNMPLAPAAINSNTLATPESKEPLNTWYQFALPAKAADGTPYLLEGSNTVAVETHVLKSNAFQVAFDLGITAKRKASCALSVEVSAEVCDGIDNDNDGVVDEAPDGSPLTRPCSTPCGNGTATCTNGVYTACTARLPTNETCNGIDDDCDGLVDNGVGQLNCDATRAVCWQGACQLVTRGTAVTTTFGRNASDWLYNDSPVADEAWKAGSVKAGVAKWRTGKAPLGTSRSGQPWGSVGTPLSAAALSLDKASRTAAYFVKTFTVTQRQLVNTFAMDLSLRRVDGAVVYLNGVEVTRSNMPLTGAVTRTTPAVKATLAGTVVPPFVPCDNCFHRTAAPLKAGVNSVAVELHTRGAAQPSFLFDMELRRVLYSACGNIRPNLNKCVRTVTDTPLPNKAPSSWLYVDGTLPTPPSNWMATSFNDKFWKSGESPLGAGKSKFKLRTNMSFGSDPEYNLLQTFYFRRYVDIPDASCYVQLTSSLLSRDGAIVYINGVEAYRYNMPSGPVGPTTSSTTFGGSDYFDTTLSGGWIKKGINVVAVEVHRYKNNLASVVFDMAISGKREGPTCSIPPGPNAKS